MIYSRCIALCIADSPHLRRGMDNPATGASVHAKTIYASRPASLILFSKCFDCFPLWPDQGRIRNPGAGVAGVQELQELQNKSQHVVPIVVIARDAAFLNSVTPELLNFWIPDSGLTNIVRDAALVPRQAL
jgi:hypothetical protein